MPDVTVIVDAKTRKLDVQITNGEPARDDTRTHKVMSRLAAIRGAWWADASGTYGRRRGKGIVRARTPSDLEADAREALAPLIAAGEILPPKGAASVGVSVTVDKARGRALFDVRWSTPGGADQSTRYALNL